MILSINLYELKLNFNIFLVFDRNWKKKPFSYYGTGTIFGWTMCSRAYLFEFVFGIKIFSDAETT